MKLLGCTGLLGFVYLISLVYVSHADDETTATSSFGSGYTTSSAASANMNKNKETTESNNAETEAQATESNNAETEAQATESSNKETETAPPNDATTTEAGDSSAQSCTLGFLSLSLALLRFI